MTEVLERVTTSRPAPTPVSSAPPVSEEINPAITCPDGTYYRKSFDELGWSTTMCKGR